MWKGEPPPSTAAFLTLASTARSNSKHHLQHTRQVGCQVEEGSQPDADTSQGAQSGQGDGYVAKHDLRWLRRPQLTRCARGLTRRWRTLPGKRKTITRLKPCESFFNIFSGPILSGTGANEHDDHEEVGARRAASDCDVVAWRCQGPMGGVRAHVACGRCWAAAVEPNRRGLRDRPHFQGQDRTSRLRVVHGRGSSRQL